MSSEWDSLSQRVRLDFEQRAESCRLAEWVCDHPEEAADMLVWLHDQVEHLEPTPS